MVYPWLITGNEPENKILYTDLLTSYLDFFTRLHVLSCEAFIKQFSILPSLFNMTHRDPVK